MAAVVVRVPSADIRAVGMSIRPVTPKSDANEDTEKEVKREIHDNTNRFINREFIRYCPLKKSAQDALFYVSTTIKYQK